MHLILSGRHCMFQAIFNSLDSNSLPLSVDTIIGTPKFLMCFLSQWHSDVPLQLKKVDQLLNLSTITPNLSSSIIAKSMQMLSIGAFGFSISAGGSLAWLGALLMHQSQLSLIDLMLLAMFGQYILFKRVSEKQNS